MAIESKFEKNSRVLWGSIVFGLTFAWWIGTVGTVIYIVGSA